MNTQTATLATSNQTAFIQVLVNERDMSNIPSFTLDTLTRGDASALISILLGTPKVANKNLDEAVPVGFYLKDETVFRVVQSKNSTRRYAKKLEVWSNGQAGWAYDAGAIKTLTLDMVLTLEQAASMGRHFGVCVICGATLSDPKSVEAGIGPVCAKKL